MIKYKTACEHGSANKLLDVEDMELKVLLFDNSDVCFTGLKDRFRLNASILR